MLHLKFPLSSSINWCQIWPILFVTVSNRKDLWKSTHDLLQCSHVLKLIPKHISETTQSRIKTRRHCQNMKTSWQMKPSHCVKDMFEQRTIFCRTEQESRWKAQEGGDQTLSQTTSNTSNETRPFLINCSSNLTH